MSNNGRGGNNGNWPKKVRPFCTGHCHPPQRPPSPDLRRLESRSPPPITLLNFNPFLYEGVRLGTFSKSVVWPVSFIKPEDCASCGLYFLQEADKVKCAFCNGELENWKEGDDPLVEHKKLSPDCPFIVGLPTGNIPLLASLLKKASLLTIDADDDDKGAPSDKGNEAGGCAASESIYNARGIVGPAHSKMVSVDCRLKTFKNWPRKEHKLSTRAMAAAGFFYVGKDDFVKCFYCNVGLKSWGEADGPWEEHARWFPTCIYVILNKGEDFVNSVLEKGDACGAGTSSKRSIEVVESSPNSELVEGEKGDSRIASSSSATAAKKDEEKGACSAAKTLEDHKSSALEDEIQLLKEQTVCKICWNNQVGVVFLPCGHLVSCTECAVALAQCALCRQPIKWIVKTYFT